MLLYGAIFSSVLKQGLWRESHCKALALRAAVCRHWGAGVSTGKGVCKSAKTCLKMFEVDWCWHIKYQYGIGIIFIAIWEIPQADDGSFLHLSPFFLPLEVKDGWKAHARCVLKACHDWTCSCWFVYLCHQPAGWHTNLAAWLTQTKSLLLRFQRWFTFFYFVTSTLLLFIIVYLSVAWKQWTWHVHITQSTGWSPYCRSWEPLPQLGTTKQAGGASTPSLWWKYVEVVEVVEVCARKPPTSHYLAYEWKPRLWQLHRTGCPQWILVAVGNLNCLHKCIAMSRYVKVLSSKSEAFGSSPGSARWSLAFYEGGSGRCGMRQHTIITVWLLLRCVLVRWIWDGIKHHEVRPWDEDFRRVI